MGYTTDFEGCFTISPALTEEHQTYLEKFAETRHECCPMYSVEDDELTEKVGLSLDENGDFPDIWCQWIPARSDRLAWDGGEKFYNYVEWLEFLIAHFFNRWGYTLSGSVTWQGEEHGDIGTILIEDGNEVKVLQVGESVTPIPTLVEDGPTEGDEDSDDPLDGFYALVAKVEHIVDRRAEIDEILDNYNRRKVALEYERDSLDRMLRDLRAALGDYI